MEAKMSSVMLLFFSLILVFGESVREECSHDLPPVFGSIHSPNFPQPYPSNLNCTWTISGQTQYDYIYIQIDAFDVNDTSSEQCANNYVQIGDKGQGLHTYCNDLRPQHVLESMTNEVVVRLVTSSMNHTSHGFTLLYLIKTHPHNTTVPPPTPSPGCGGHIGSGDPMGTIDSPNYPTAYGPNLNCTWIITGKTLKDEIQVHFDIFVLKDDTDCKNNYLLMGDVHDKDNQQRFCDANRPPTYYRSNSNSLQLTLVTDGKSHEGEAFSLVYLIRETNKTITTTTAAPSTTLPPTATAEPIYSSPVNHEGWKIAFGVILGLVLLFLVIDLILCRKRRGCIYSVCRSRKKYSNVY